jgi:hypothetical protein
MRASSGGEGDGVSDDRESGCRLFEGIIVGVLFSLGLPVVLP